MLTISLCDDFSAYCHECPERTAEIKDSWFEFVQKAAAAEFGEVEVTWHHSTRVDDSDCDGALERRADTALRNWWDDFTRTLT